jgi:hypothetical protein
MLDIDVVPYELRSRAQWLVWRFEPNLKKPEAKPLKVPYWTNGKKRYGVQGDEKDRKNLVTLDVAMSVLAADRPQPYAGIGFAFLPDDGLIGVDIDKCIDTDSGEISPMAMGIIGACASYTEYSPSGTGVHIIVSGHTETFKSNKIGLEVFCSSQFFTFTGRLFAGAPDDVNPIAESTLNRLRTTVKGARPVHAAGSPPPPPGEGVDELARLEAALGFVSADEHDVWIRVGMGLFTSLGESGFRLWDYWSSKADNYGGPDECKKRWASFGKRGSNITAATIFKLAIDNNWKPPRSVMPPPIKSRTIAKPPPPPSDSGHDITTASAPPPPSGEGVSANQDSREVGEGLAGVETPGEVVAQVPAPVPASARSAAAHAFVESLVSDFDDGVGMDDIPFGEPDGFAGGGGARKPKDKPKKVYGDDHWAQVADVLENFILIYGEDLVWDCRQRMLMKLSSMRTIVQNSDVMKFWGGDARKWVLKKNIVFDPRETPSPAISGPTATVNLFSGWKMKPKAGNCVQIRVLLSHLCDGNEDLETWILRWLAYPLRNPGAKMETSIIMHGDEGSGKNFFFERVVKMIYGEYGYVIGNAQLESNFNDWASMKLFMVADEVVTRSELKQMKGKLKGLVAGDTVIVNPKGLPEHVEANQMNFVFLSNELQPLALDKTDRRYLVVWTPPALSREFYMSVASEIEAGGIEAFYHYLVHDVEMGDFDEHTKPIYNEAKDKLIEKSLAPAERFYREWASGLLPIPFVTCSVVRLYEVFKVWCGRSGESKYTSQCLFSPSVARYAGGVLKHHTIKYDLESEVKQRFVFLVGEQPEGKSFREWAESTANVFESGFRTYRKGGTDDVDT